MRFALALIFFAFSAASAAAQEVGSVEVDAASMADDAAAVYADACEKIRPDEAKSTLRVKVTDKASFKAVSTLGALAEVKARLSDNDFNVLVYDLVDNAIEDMAIRTVSQTPEEICVEITGYIRKENILNALKQSSKPTEPVVEETHNDEPPVDFGIPVLYVAPVEFYNNSSSVAHAELVKSALNQGRFAFAGDENSANYTIKSKVMRAKVDPINSSTSRLQMVVSLEVVNNRSNESFVEHQNRFVLFNSASENEQKVALDLMKKLFTQASEQIAKQIEKQESKKAGAPMIVPSAR